MLEVEGVEIENEVGKPVVRGAAGDVGSSDAHIICVWFEFIS